MLRVYVPSDSALCIASERIEAISLTASKCSRITLKIAGKFFAERLKPCLEICIDVRFRQPPERLIEIDETLALSIIRRLEIEIERLLQGCGLFFEITFDALDDGEDQRARGIGMRRNGTRWRCRAPGIGGDDSGNGGSVRAAAYEALWIFPRMQRRSFYFPLVGFRSHDHLCEADRAGLGQRRRQAIHKHRAPDRSRRSLAEQRLGILGHKLIKHLA